MRVRRLTIEAGSVSQVFLKEEGTSGLAFVPGRVEMDIDVPMDKVDRNKEGEWICKVFVGSDGEKIALVELWSRKSSSDRGEVFVNGQRAEIARAKIVKGNEVVRDIVVASIGGAKKSWSEAITLREKEDPIIKKACEIYNRVWEETFKDTNIIPVFVCANGLSNLSTIQAILDEVPQPSNSVLFIVMGPETADRKVNRGGDYRGRKIVTKLIKTFMKKGGVVLYPQTEDEDLKVHDKRILQITEAISCSMRYHNHSVSTTNELPVRLQGAVHIAITVNENEIVELKDFEEHKYPAIDVKVKPINANQIFVSLQASEHWRKFIPTYIGLTLGKPVLVCFKDLHPKPLANLLKKYFNEDAEDWSEYGRFLAFRYIKQAKEALNTLKTASEKWRQDLALRKLRTILHELHVLAKQIQWNEVSKELDNLRGDNRTPKEIFEALNKIETLIRQHGTRKKKARRISRIEKIPINF